MAPTLLAPLQDGPLSGRSLGHVRGPTSVAEENLAQTVQNPEGYRYAVDCTWTDAQASVLAPMLRELWSELETEHSFSIWYGWAPTGSRPDMAFSVEADVYVATYVIYSDPADDARHTEWVHRRTAALAAAHGTGVYLGDTDFSRRQDRFLSDDAYRRLAAIRAKRDPAGRFASYLTRDPEGLNVHG
jgi:FAD/FMN-containing dehydrogenase